MKNIIILLLLLCLTKNHAQSPIDCYKVGDIVHSIFQPEKFNQLHDGMWKLVTKNSVFSNFDSTDILKYAGLDPKIFVKDSSSGTLKTHLSFDSNNSFIRSMNESRIGLYGDVIRSKNNSDIFPGHFHNSTLLVHRHEFHLDAIPFGLAHIPTELNVTSTNIYKPGSASSSWEGIRSTTNGSEVTRPQNVCLYTYIKVKDGIVLQNYDCYKVGDVIFSVNEPNKFNELHGQKWLLFAGQYGYTRDIYQKHNYPYRFPDARGAFIKGTIDKFSDFQFDAFESHNHEIRISVTHGISYAQAPPTEYKVGPYRVFNQYSYGEGTLGEFQESTESSKALSYPNLDEQGVVARFSEKETRPRNIALYIYIKVDE